MINAEHNPTLDLPRFISSCLGTPILPIDTPRNALSELPNKFYEILVDPSLAISIPNSWKFWTPELNRILTGQYLFGSRAREISPDKQYEPFKKFGKFENLVIPHQDDKFPPSDYDFLCNFDTGNLLKPYLKGAGGFSKKPSFSAPGVEILEFRTPDQILEFWLLPPGYPNSHLKHLILNSASPQHCTTAKIMDGMLIPILPFGLRNADYFLDDLSKLNSRFLIWNPELSCSNGNLTNIVPRIIKGLFAEPQFFGTMSYAVRFDNLWKLTESKGSLTLEEAKHICNAFNKAEHYMLDDIPELSGPRAAAAFLCKSGILEVIGHCAMLANDQRTKAIVCQIHFCHDATEPCSLTVSEVVKKLENSRLILQARDRYPLN